MKPSLQPRISMRILCAVRTRVVEEKETAAGRVTEISRDYIAISRKTGDVFYFGEVVGDCENGQMESPRPK